MNERIKKLARQSGFGLHKDSEIYTSRLEHLPITEDLEKFAELIIRECIEQIDINNYNSGDEWDAAMTCASNAIKEHFGVKE